MDLNKLREILKIVAESDVAEIEIDEDGAKVTIRKESPTVLVQPSPYFAPAHPHFPAHVTPAPVPSVNPGPLPPAAAPEASDQPAPTVTQPTAPAEPNEFIVKAPIVGTFYRSPSPDSDPYVEVGSAVTSNSVVCIIEAMKLMNEIECEVAGRIKQVLVEDGEPVEYDQPLFVIEKG
jgi:acetyl-CoA carboxylase biotin carboxyl carrier protein